MNQSESLHHQPQQQLTVSKLLCLSLVQLVVTKTYNINPCTVYRVSHDFFALSLPVQLFYGLSKNKELPMEVSLGVDMIISSGMHLIMVYHVLTLCGVVNKQILIFFCSAIRFYTFLHSSLIRFFHAEAVPQVHNAHKKVKEKKEIQLKSSRS